MDPMQFARMLQQGQQDKLAGIGSGLGLQAAGAMGGAGLGAMGAPAMAPGLGAEAAAGELGGGMSPAVTAGLISMLASGLGDMGRDRRVQSRVGMPEMPKLGQFRPSMY